MNKNNIKYASIDIQKTIKLILAKLRKEGWKYTKEYRHNPPDLIMINLLYTCHHPIWKLKAYFGYAYYTASKHDSLQIDYWTLEAPGVYRCIGMFAGEEFLKSGTIALMVEKLL